MLQYIFNTESVLNVTSIPNFLEINTAQLPQEEIRILVDTSIPRTVILPYSSVFPVRNVKITVVDTTGAAAANNITVQASAGSPNDAINGASSFLVNQAFQANRFELLNTNEWAVLNGGTSGGSVPLAVNLTYAQLISAIGANALITGQRILLTDYQTATYIQFSGTGGGGIGGEAVNVGSIEPLLLTAISSNQVSMLAESVVNSQDTILYMPVVADYDYDYAAAQGKGCIIYRQNNQTNVSRDYDFRAVVFRRWETVIGNGNFWSFTPVAGAAFQDYTCFGGFIAIHISVRSPLSVHAAFGVPYWLDNTIFLFVQGAIFSSVGLAYGNTLAGLTSDGTFNGNIIGALINNIIINDTIQNNSIGTCGNNNIVALTGGMGGDVMNMNVFNSFMGNSMSNINGNTIEVITTNTITSLTNNSGSLLDANTVTTISDNMFTTIQNNISTTINDNLIGGILNNAIANILGNVADVISSNTNAGDITSNVASLITLNTNGGSISYNTVGYNISGNANDGGINYNMGDTIQNQSSNVGTISNNIVSLISANVINGNILGNVGINISSNSGTGNIENNNYSGIIGNNVGGIAFNIGYECVNNTLTGTIQGNNVTYLNTNTETIASNILTCNGQNISGNTLSGDLQDVDGRIYSCAISAPIRVHNCIDVIHNKTVTPTAEMQNIATPTKTIISLSNSQHYIMQLSAGILTFPTSVTT